MQREPVLRVAHRLVPGEVLEDVGLLLRVSRALGERGEQPAGEIVDQLIELRQVEAIPVLALLGLADLRIGGGLDPRLAAPYRGCHPVHEAPVARLEGGDRLVEEEDLARPLVADDERKPLCRAAAGHRADVGADLLHVRVLGDRAEIARQLRLVAAAHRHPVDSRDHRLAGVEMLRCSAEQRHVLQ
jgi:hypothetical protein